MNIKFKKASMIAALIATLALGGCGSSKKKSSGGSASMEGTDVEQTMEDEQPNMGSSFDVNADSDSGTAGTLQTVYFAYNSFQISSAAKESLKANAEFLKANTTVEVQIEGHCDERGGVQYNIALGEQRAKAVKRYLTALGVQSSRITTISFGKERPLEFGHDDSSWSKNRRGNFVITAK